MKSLVTGVAGFLGSYLAERLLKEGSYVIGIDSFSPYYKRSIKEANLKNLKKSKNFSFLEVSVEEFPSTPLAAEDIDYIFHFAAQPGVRGSWGPNFERYNSSNIMATQKLLEWVKKKNIKKLIYASSSSVYGDTKSFPTDEKSIPNPLSPYGITKLAGELLCFAYRSNFGVPILALRFFSVYGPRQRPDMAFHKFILSTLKGKEINIYGSGESIRDFTYVEDAIEGTILALKYGREGEVYNIGRGSPIKLNDAIVSLQEAFAEVAKDKKIKISYLPPQAGEAKITWANIAKANSHFNFSPKKDLREGLKEEIEWIRELYHL
jgi:UDP-glucose 4-epimerase